MPECGHQRPAWRAAYLGQRARGVARILGFLAFVLLFVVPVRAQNLIDLYVTERLRIQALELGRRAGVRAALRPPDPLPYAGDTLRAWLLARRPMPLTPAPEPPPPPFTVERWRLMKKLERNWFEKTFRDTNWAFLGSNTFSPLDTLRTQELRARLQAHFGPPTRTIVELEDPEQRSREELIEFEYWFVLNDTIPLVLMDVNGPFERGLVTATDHRFRDILFDVKETFLRDLVADAKRAPYVDYYYQYDTGTWYLTGYDGSAFFLRRIARPPLFRGRPRLRGPTG